MDSKFYINKPLEDQKQGNVMMASFLPSNPSFHFWRTRAFLCWPSYFSTVQHSSVERISPLRESWYFFEIEENLTKRLRKGTSLLRILSTISQIILSKCLVFIYCIHLLLSTVNKWSPFPLLCWLVYFINNYLCVCFLFFSLCCVCNILNIYYVLFTRVCPLTTTNSICDLFTGNNQLLSCLLEFPNMW